MKTKEEIEEELENRKNSVQNLTFLIERTGNEQFELPLLESEISIGVLEWVLGKREFTEETIMINPQEISSEEDLK